MSRSISSTAEDANDQRPSRRDWPQTPGTSTQTATVDVIATLPVLAAGFAVPQFIPQITKLRRTYDTAGLSPSWALLTGINNTAWLGYFAASRYWLALIPSSSAALLGGYLGLMLSRGPRALRRSTGTTI